METLPYVYRLTHKVTGQFYIGYRYRNKLPAVFDLPIYQTSSDKVKELGFDNFSWEILSEFIFGEDAYDYENELIEANINDPLCLNGRYQKNGDIRFRMPDTHTDEARRKISEGHKGNRLSQETKAKISAKLKGNKNRPKKPKYTPIRGRRFIVKSPDGMEHEGINLSEFCKKNGLTMNTMSLVCRGEYSQHKGWTGSYV